MRRTLGALLWFILAPGSIVVLIPWLWFGWKQETPFPGWYGFRILGLLLFATAGLVLARAFVRFVLEGRGTPAPYLPTRRLVVSGAYRYVRNPMYVAVLAMILGEALVFGRWQMLVYGAAVGLGLHLYVRAVEEPRLRRTFGSPYETYCQEVRRWVPDPKPKALFRR